MKSLWVFGLLVGQKEVKSETLLSIFLSVFQLTVVDFGLAISATNNLISSYSRQLTVNTLCFHLTSVEHQTDKNGNWLVSAVEF